MHIETEATQHLQHAAASARTASHVLARTPDAERNAALRAMAVSLRSQSSDIIAANAADLAACTGTAAFRDRLALNQARVEAMARGLEDIALLPDPLGRTLADWTRPNGLRIQRIATPIGVIGMIYESRPECRRGCRRHLPEVGQRGDPARRVGKRAQRRCDQCRSGGRAARRRIAGSLRADRAQCRPRLCRARCWRRPVCST